METSVNNKCKAFTSLEQSRKLAEILPLDSADMKILSFGIDIKRRVVPIDDIAVLNREDEIPCWSLAALLNVLSEEVSLNSFKDGNWNAMVQQNGKMIYSDANNPVDTCYELILKLHELKRL